MYFDSHAHLDDERFQKDFEEILARMKHSGVTAMMNIGCDLPSSENSVRLAETYPWVWAAVGSHPDDADHVNEARIAVYRKMCKNPRVKAIGEIGLDYHYEDVPRDVQKTAFRMQMALAQELDLPVIFHDREAHGDSLAIVREFPQVRGVFHCYSGSLEDAKTLIRLGWNLSFTGSVTYKNAKKLPEVAAWVPEDRFMIETDSPYLLPYPRVKGEKRNDSSKLPRIAAKIAALRGLTEAEVERITTENGKAFFRLP